YGRGKGLAGGGDVRRNANCPAFFSSVSTTEGRLVLSFLSIVFDRDNNFVSVLCTSIFNTIKV
ncbi:MAG TPA: hypothetical protein ACFYEK_17365, partial [Candidatus Wunengus sp. YC60]